MVDAVPVDCAEQEAAATYAWLRGSVSLALVLSTVPFLHGTRRLPELFADPKELGLHISATIATLGTFLLLRRARWRAGWQPHIAGVLVVIMFLGLVSASVGSVNPWLTWRSVSLAASGSLIFALARPLGSDDKYGVRGVLLVLAFIVALISCAEAFFGAPDLSQYGRAPGGLIGNRNQASHLLALSLPLWWLSQCEAKSSCARVVALVGCGVCACSITLSRSRASWLAVFACGLLIMLASAVCRRISFRASAIWLSGVVAGAIVAVSVPTRLEWSTPRPFLDTGARLIEFDRGSGLGRLTQHVTSARLIQQAPLLGVGPGQWQFAYARVAGSRDPSFRPLAISPTPRTPQSDWMAIATEWGLPSVLLILGGLFLLAVRAAREVRGLASDRAVTHSLACIVTICTVVWLGAFDVLLGTAAGLAWTAAIVATLAPRIAVAGYADVGSRHTGRVAVLLMFGCMSLSGAILAGQRTSSQWLLRRNPTIADAQRAIRLDPSNYETRIAIAAFWSRSGRCDLALDPLREARRLHPSARPAIIMQSHCATLDARIPRSRLRTLPRIREAPLVTQ